MLNATVPPVALIVPDADWYVAVLSWICSFGCPTTPVGIVLPAGSV